MSGVDKLNADSFTWAQYISTSFPKNILQDYKTSHEGQEEIDLEPSDHEGSDDDIWVATKVATQLIQGRYVGPPISNVRSRAHIADNELASS